MLPDSLPGKMVLALREYMDAEADEPAMLRSIERAEKVQNGMLEETAAVVGQSPNSLTSLFVQSLGSMRDLIE
jgi:hypothetical protein